MKQIKRILRDIVYVSKLTGTYNKKTLYYLCFILINLLSFYLMMLIMGYFMKMNVH